MSVSHKLIAERLSAEGVNVSRETVRKALNGDQTVRNRADILAMRAQLLTEAREQQRRDLDATKAVLADALQQLEAMS
jgi:hypothetical protein